MRPAQVDYFLKIDGIEGESQDSKHTREIEVLNWSWGECQAMTVSQGGGIGAGKVSMREFQFVMAVNKAVLTCRKAGKEQQEYLTIKFSDLMVTSYDCTGDPSAPIPTDQISMAFTRFDVDYKEQRADGTLGGAIKGSYDLKQNYGG